MKLKVDRCVLVGWLHLLRPSNVCVCTCCVCVFVVTRARIKLKRNVTRRRTCHSFIDSNAMNVILHLNERFHSVIIVVVVIIMQLKQKQQTNKLAALTM